MARLKRSNLPLLLAPFFLALLSLPLAFRTGPWGTWEGVLEAGGVKFRVALVLQRGPDGALLARFNNIDDGIYGQPFSHCALGFEDFTGTLPTGESLALSRSSCGWGSRLVGTYTQAHGSFQKPGVLSRLELVKGDDFMVPRRDARGIPVASYVYHRPARTEDGLETGDWQGGPETFGPLTRGMNKVLLGDYPHLHGVLLLKGGKLVLEEYFYGYGREDLHPLQSITKSVFSLLFGVLADQGSVSPARPLYGYFPGYRTKPGWSRDKDLVTLGDLLTMRGGFDCDDWKDSTACSWKMVDSPDWLDFALSLPLARRPGERFAYCGSCLTPLSEVLRRKGGMDLPALAGKNLFGPLGITGYEWMKGPNGVTPASFGLSLRPRDLAKLGQLVLQKGLWKGKRVLSEGWIERSTSVQVQRDRGKGEADYGYLWWIRSLPLGKGKVKVLDGWGVGGNHLFIVPSLDLVCVVMAGNYKDGKLGAKSLELFQEYLLGAGNAP